jgi:phage terminase large subunit
MTATPASALEHVYCPRGSAVELFGARDDEVLMSGPAGTGKSRACLEKLNLQALKYPGMAGLIVRKTAASLGSTALRTWRRDVVSEAIRRGVVRYYGGSEEEPPQYRYENGSSIFIGGMDRPSKIMSSEYDSIFVQEATELRVDDWEALFTRLRNGRLPYQQLVGDCNPDTPTHWLLKRAQAGQTRMIHCQHEDNPVLYADDGSMTDRGEKYMRKLDALTGVRLLRLRRGLWVAAEGVIYEEYQAAKHLVTATPIPRDWRRYWAVDFGFKNPFVLQCWAESPDGVLHLYREIYRTRRTVDQHARDILAIVRPGGPDSEWIEPLPEFIVADHDAESRERFSRELGIGTVAADKRVTEGIQLVQARLAAFDDGNPRIIFHADAVVHRDSELVDIGLPTSTVEEISGYIRSSSEAPVKENDHGMDAMRYLIAEVDGRRSRRPNIRWI